MSEWRRKIRNYVGGSGTRGNYMNLGLYYVSFKLLSYNFRVYAKLVVSSKALILYGFGEKSIE